MSDGMVAGRHLGRKVHLAEPVYRTRHYLRAPGDNTMVFDMSTRRADEIIAWKPVCGAPQKGTDRRRRASDGISCKRCQRTRIYKKWERRDGSR